MTKKNERHIVNNKTLRMDLRRRNGAVVRVFDFSSVLFMNMCIWVEFVCGSRFAPRVFLWFYPVFLHCENPTLPISNSTKKEHLHEN